MLRPPPAGCRKPSARRPDRPRSASPAACQSSIPVSRLTAWEPTSSRVAKKHPWAAVAGSYDRLFRHPRRSLRPAKTNRGTPLHPDANRSNRPAGALRERGAARCWAAGAGRAENGEPRGGVGRRQRRRKRRRARDQRKTPRGPWPPSTAASTKPRYLLGHQQAAQRRRRARLLAPNSTACRTIPPPARRST